jgi:hypothetical protein
MTIAEFRRMVKENYPHVTIKVRTVSFQDLARISAKCLTVEGERSWQELAQINEWASQAGITQDGSLRGYANVRL